MSNIELRRSAGMLRFYILFLFIFVLGAMFLYPMLDTPEEAECFKYCATTYYYYTLALIFIFVLLTFKGVYERYIFGPIVIINTDIILLRKVFKGDLKIDISTVLKAHIGADYLFKTKILRLFLETKVYKFPSYAEINGIDLSENMEREIRKIITKTKLVNSKRWREETKGYEKIF